jgi:hypothetical protein
LASIVKYRHPCRQISSLFNLFAKFGPSQNPHLIIYQLQTARQAGSQTIKRITLSDERCRWTTLEDKRCTMRPHLGKLPRVDILKGFHHVATGTTKLIRMPRYDPSRPHQQFVCHEDAGEGN